jgi:hypothetical protein
MTVTNNIYQRQIKYYVFNAVTNSELIELVPVFTMRPFRILFAVPATWQCVDHKNVVVPEALQWSSAGQT